MLKLAALYIRVESLFSTEQHLLVSSNAGYVLHGVIGFVKRLEETLWYG